MVWPGSTAVSTPLEEPDVLVGHEHVDEAAELALLVEETLGEPGCATSSCLEHVFRPWRRRR